MILDKTFPSCHVVRIIVQIRAQYADFDNPHNPESIDARALPEPNPRMSRPYPWVIIPCGWRKFGGSGFFRTEVYPFWCDVEPRCDACIGN